MGSLSMGTTGVISTLSRPSTMTSSTTIWAALRKRETPEPTVPYVLRDLTIDYAARQATFAGNQVRLTAIEFRTLVELSANAG